MPDYLEEVEPLVSEIRKEGLNRFESKISPFVDQPWSNLIQEIDVLDQQ